MKILIIHPGRPPVSKEEIKCFTDLWSYYLPRALAQYMQVTETVPDSQMSLDGLRSWFDQLPVHQYDAVLAMGLRYFSKLPRDIPDSIRKRLFPGFLCQLYDGSRLDNDGVDITFTIKNDDLKHDIDSGANRYVRHHAYNQYIGWAADSELNSPAQDSAELRILIDHTNYGPNTIDHTARVLHEIKHFISTDLWHDRFSSVRVRRFDSGQVIDVDWSNLDVNKYDKSKSMPYPDICREHSSAHVFCVTHPESVGQVVLETAMAGALILSPKGCISADRLACVRAIEWDNNIDWYNVVHSISPQQSRAMALTHSWSQVARQIRAGIWTRAAIRGQK